MKLSVCVRHAVRNISLQFLRCNYFIGTDSRMTASGAVSLRCAATQLDGATRPSSCLIEGDRVVGVSYALCRVPICSQFR